MTILDNFEAGEGRFNQPPTASGTSAGFVVANTSITHDLTLGQASSGSQRIVVDDDPNVNVTTTFNWRLRNLSGLNGAPANNQAFASDGFVGFWARTSTPSLQASIVIDDGTQTERGRYINIIADGQWHAYEWNLDATTASTEWFNFNAGNNLINEPNVTVDAVYILSPFATGTDTDAVLNIDNVSFNPTGSITVPEPSSLGAVGIGAVALLRRRRSRRD